MRLASIDIGTNTLLLLIVDCNHNKIDNVLVDEHKIARLGEDLNSTGLISNIALDRAKKILLFYKSIISEYNVEQLFCVATSAMRDASNSKEIKKELEYVIGSEIKIIGGEDEAKLSYLGSIEDHPKNTVIDIGGGSTEIILGSGSTITFKKSVDVGAVRLSEMFNLFEKKQDDIKKAEDHVRKAFSIFPTSTGHQAIAVAGTPTTIAQINLGLDNFSAEKVHLIKISLKELLEAKSLIINNSKEDLINNYGVHPNRADVILGGTIILETFLKAFDFNDYLTSVKGLRYGVVIDYLRKN